MRVDPYDVHMERMVHGCFARRLGEPRTGSLPANRTLLQSFIEVLSPGGLPPMFMRGLRTEEIRKAAAAEWQATFDVIGDIVCVIDAVGVITRANRAALAAFAQPAASVIGQPWGPVMAKAFPGVDENMLTSVV